MKTKRAAVYVTDFNDWKYCELSIKSVRYFNPDIDVYILTYGKPSEENIKKCEKANAECIDIQALFD